MVDLLTIKLLLEKIGRSRGDERLLLISDLQERIWSNEDVDDISESLRDLAYSLNFYEPFEPDRDESLGYFDDTKLDELIVKASALVASALPGH